MAYKIVNMWTPSSMYQYKAPYAMTPQYVTIHETGNNATARGEVSYMNSNYNYTSFHVAIDDKEVVQAIPFNRNGFHAGDGQGQGNRASIGIEICYNKDNGYYGEISERMEDAIENATLYTAYILHQYGWGVDRLRQHWHWSGKNCPQKIRQTGRWEWFKNRVQQHLNAIKKGSTASKTTTKAKKAPAKKSTKPTPKKTVAKKPAKPKKIAWGWTGVFTANTTIAVRKLKKGQTIPSLTSTLVDEGSYIKKGQWVNWDRLYYIQGYWWIRFKYPTNPSAGYFYMTVGKKESGVTFSQANSKNKLWGKVFKMNTKENKTKVTNWAEKGSIK